MRNGVPAARRHQEVADPTRARSDTPYRCRALGSRGLRSLVPSATLPDTPPAEHGSPRPFQRAISLYRVTQRMSCLEVCGAMRAMLREWLNVVPGGEFPGDRKFTDAADSAVSVKE